MTAIRLPSIRIDSIRTSRLFETLAKVAASLLLAAGLTGGAATASAQSPSASADPASESVSAQWQEHFDEQMALQLRENSAGRASFIQVVIDQASKREDLKLPRASEALLHVIENDAKQERQMMAVQALSAIGPKHLEKEQYEQVMSRLYTLAEKASSEQLQNAIADAIEPYQVG